MPVMDEKPNAAATSSRELVYAGVAYPLVSGLFLAHIGPWGLLSIGYLILASLAVPAALVSAVLLRWLVTGAYAQAHVLLFVVWVCVVAFGVMRCFMEAWAAV